MKVFRILFLVILIAAVCVAFYFYRNQDIVITPIEEVAPTQEQQAQQPTLNVSVEGTLEEQLNATQVDVSIDELDARLAEPTVVPTTKIKVFNDQLSAPYGIVIDSYGNSIVTDADSNAVYVLQDTDGDYISDTRTKIVKDLNSPHGIAVHGNDIYIAEADKIRVLRGMVKDGSFVRNEVFIENLPADKGFLEKYIAIAQDSLYISIGASCSDCEEVNGRSEIRKYSLLDKSYEVVATKVKFPRDLSVTASGEILYSDSQFPQITAGDSINSLTTTIPITLDSHTRPAGVVSYTGVMFPEYQGKFLIALSGAFDLATPKGFKVIALSKDTKSEDVLTDVFLRGTSVRGKPFDIAIGNRGEIYVSDVLAGKIYVIVKE